MNRSIFPKVSFMISSSKNTRLSTQETVLNHRHISLSIMLRIYVGLCLHSSPISGIHHPTPLLSSNHLPSLQTYHSSHVRDNNVLHNLIRGGRGNGVAEGALNRQRCDAFESRDRSLKSYGPARHIFCVWCVC